MKIIKDFPLYTLQNFGVTLVHPSDFSDTFCSSFRLLGHPLYTFRAFAQRFQQIVLLDFKIGTILWCHIVWEASIDAKQCPKNLLNILKSIWKKYRQFLKYNPNFWLATRGPPVSRGSHPGSESLFWSKWLVIILPKKLFFYILSVWAMLSNTVTQTLLVHMIQKICFWTHAIRSVLNI